MARKAVSPLNPVTRAAVIVPAPNANAATVVPTARPSRLATRGAFLSGYTCHQLLRTGLTPVVTSPPAPTTQPAIAAPPSVSQPTPGMKIGAPPVAALKIKNPPAPPVTQP